VAHSEGFIVRISCLQSPRIGWHCGLTLQQREEANPLNSLNVGNPRFRVRPVTAQIRTFRSFWPPRTVLSCPFYGVTHRCGPDG
jgi:hypothetical protein